MPDLFHQSTWLCLVQLSLEREVDIPYKGSGPESQKEAFLEGGKEGVG